MADEQNPMPEDVRKWERVPISPEIIAAILAEYDNPETIAEIRQMIAGGGISSDEFLAEVDRVVEEVTTRHHEQAPVADV